MKEAPKQWNPSACQVTYNVMAKNSIETNQMYLKRNWFDLIINWEQIYVVI